MKTRILSIFAVVCCMAFLGGCESMMRKAAFEYTGYKAAAEVIAHHEGNREVVESIDRAIDAVLLEDSILFSVVETWYADQKEELGLLAIEQELLDMLIAPLWADLKEKYGGKVLDLRNAAVVNDIVDFQMGMKLALRDMGG